MYRIYWDSRHGGLTVGYTDDWMEVAALLESDPHLLYEVVR